MTFLTLQDGARVVYLEGIKSGALSEIPDEVARHAVVYDRVQANALSPEASMVLIRKVMEEHYRCVPNTPI